MERETPFWVREVGSDEWKPRSREGKGRGDMQRVRTAKPAVLYHTHPHPRGRLKNQFLLVALDVWEWACFQVARMNRYHYILSLEKARAPHSSTLAWKIPWAEEPGWSGL